MTTVPRVFCPYACNIEMQGENLAGDEATATDQHQTNYGLRTLKVNY